MFLPDWLCLNPVSNSRQFPSALGAGHQPCYALHTVSFNRQAPRMKQLLLLRGKCGTEKVSSLPRYTQLVTQNWDSNSKPAV